MPETIRTILRLAALCLGLIAGTVQAAGSTLAIIAHPDNPVAGLAPEEVARVYLGKTSTFPNGSKAVPVDQSLQSPSREMFYSRVVKKTNTEVTAHWSKLLFTGMATPPNVLKNDAAVKAWVAANPDGMGYVDGKIVDGSVKVLLIVR